MVRWIQEFMVQIIGFVHLHVSRVASEVEADGV